MDRIAPEGVVHFNAKTSSQLVLPSLCQPDLFTPPRVPLRYHALEHAPIDHPQPRPRTPDDRRRAV